MDTHGPTADDGTARRPRASLDELAREVAELRTTLQADRDARAAETRAAEARALWWRWAGGLVAGAALTLGTAAVKLASTAATDHDRVDRLEVQALTRAEREGRLLEQVARTTAAVEEMQRALTEMRADLREIRAETRRLTTDQERR